MQSSSSSTTALPVFIEAVRSGDSGCATSSRSSETLIKLVPVRRLYGQEAVSSYLPSASEDENRSTGGPHEAVEQQKNQEFGQLVLKEPK